MEDNLKIAKTKLFKIVKLEKTKPEEVNILLQQYNIDINVKNAWGETLIYNCAKHSCNVELMNWLYEHGCDPSIVNNKKYNAFNACLEWNHKKNFV
jgi:hypothetical protein